MQRLAGTEQGFTPRTSKYVFDELIKKHGCRLACSQCSMFQVKSVFLVPDDWD